MALRTRVLRVSPDEPDPAALDEAAEVLRRGGLVAFATETVYGLGADATDPEAVARIFEAKGRPSFNPLIVHVDRVEAAIGCAGDWPEAAGRLARRFWPGPLTLVVPRARGIIPDVVTAGRETVGLRVPAPEVARGLFRRAGVPVAAPSANRSTGISPTEAWHVLDDLDGRIDLVLDSGPTGVGIESTVLDLTTAPPRVLRPGSVTVASLAEALGSAVLAPVPHEPGSGPVSSPGQMSVHYAPRTPTFRVGRDALEGLAERDGRWALVSIGRPPGSIAEPKPARHVRLETPPDAEARLYACLHELDREGLDYLVIVPPPDEPRWLAIADRVRRASNPWPSEGRKS